MAIREVRIMGDDILGKQCKPVTKMTMRTKILIEDMLDTMYEKYGVGLAAPQVGVLKQIVVIDVGEGPSCVDLTRRSLRHPGSRQAKKDV